MPLPPAAKSKESAKTPRRSARVLYLYAVSRMPDRRTLAIVREGIDGAAPVEPFRAGRYLCWISRVDRTDFADRLSERMQDLNWLAAAGLRHQRVVAEIAEKLPTLPARFGAVFLSEASLAKHIAKRERTLRTAFARVADADEYGVKVFATAAPKSRPVVSPSSGADYLKKKAAMLRPSGSSKLDPGVQVLTAALKKLAVADAPGGKASAGQPGLLWHGSFLIRRKDRGKLAALLSKYARAWNGMRRIDCSGPWPPYSFVGQDV